MDPLLLGIDMGAASTNGVLATFDGDVVWHVVGEATQLLLQCGEAGDVKRRSTTSCASSKLGELA